jgi:hypothetical protein
MYNICNYNLIDRLGGTGSTSLTARSASTPRSTSKSFGADGQDKGYVIVEKLLSKISSLAILGKSKKWNHVGHQQMCSMNVPMPRSQYRGEGKHVTEQTT